VRQENQMTEDKLKGNVNLCPQEAQVNDSNIEFFLLKCVHCI